MSDEKSVKVDILLKALEHTQVNYRHLLDRSRNLFSWIGSVLLAVVGAIAALGPGRLASFGAHLQVGLTVAIVSVSGFGWISEMMTFKARVEEGKSAVKIGRLLHFFEAGYFDEDTVIFDERDWTNWMNSRLGRWGVSQNTAVLFVLMTIAIVMVWAS